MHEAFIGDSQHHAFMHGPTFMGNPLACRVALESLRVFEEEHYLEKIAALSQTLQRELLEDVALRAHPAVADVRVLGATAVIEAHSSEALKGVAAFARARGVWLRPIGRWLYTMPAYIATDAELTQITGVMKAWFWNHAINVPTHGSLNLRPALSQGKIKFPAYATGVQALARLLPPWH